MKRMLFGLFSWLLVLAAAAPFWGCGTTFEIVLERGDGASVTGRAVVEGSKRTFEGQADGNGYIEWNIDGCSGSAHVAPNSQVKVSCSDPLLVEWPDCWTLVSATWFAHDLGIGGTILVDPAGAFYIDPIYGSIQTDPGYSAWLLNLDVENITSSALETVLIFDTTDCPDSGACLKGLDVALVEPLTPPGQPLQIVPTEGLGVDFTAFPEGDYHVICIDGAVPTRETTWGKVRTLFR